MKKQQGSAHVVIVVVLVTALLGALGFIFWQNFMSQDTESTKQTDQTSSVQEEQQPVADKGYEPTIPDGWSVKSIEGVGVSFAVPSDWDGDVSAKKYKLDEDIEILNSGAAIYVRYSTKANDWEVRRDDFQGQGLTKTKDTYTKSVDAKAEDKWPTLYYEVRAHTGLGSQYNVLVATDEAVYQLSLPSVTREIEKYSDALVAEFDADRKRIRDVIPEFVKTITFE